jgi:hypothetical protein
LPTTSANAGPGCANGKLHFQQQHSPDSETGERFDIILGHQTNTRWRDGKFVGSFVRVHIAGLSGHFRDHKSER